MPVSVEWQEWLWQKAQEQSYRYNANLIKITEGYGIAAAAVHTSTNAWLELIRQHLDLECILHRTQTGYAKHLNAVPRIL